MTRIIAIVSGKGGTGKTTTAVNLAVALSDIGKDVILCDANFSTPHICLHLGVEMPSLSLYEVMVNNKKISNALYLHPTGIKFIPNRGSHHLEDSHIARFSEMMLELVGRCDLVLIDVGPTLTKDKIASLKVADEAIIVTKPELPALVEAKKSIKSAEELGAFVPGVIINMVNKRYSIPISDISRYMGKAVLGSVPEDMHVTKSLFVQHPVIYTAPTSPSAREFRKLAELLAV